jgi:tape measure domain-containing protein
MTQTINIANIKVGYNVDELRKNGQFTRNELNSIARIARESIDPFDKYETELEKLARAFKAGGLTADAFARTQETLAKKLGINVPTGAMAQYTQSMELLRNKLQSGAISADAFRQSQLALQNQLGLTTKEAQKQTEAMAAQQSAINAVKNLAMGYAGLGVAISGIKSAINMSADMEQTKVSFEVMTGSAKTASSIMADFKKLDVESPINFADFARAGKTLLQFGVTADNIRPTLQRLSAISLGNPEQFQSLALAFGQVQANGKLMGQEVLQMVNAGFNPLQEISRTTGMSMEELRKKMEQGSISAQMVADAFKSATEEGGRFAGMNEKLAATLSGQFAKAGGDVKALAIDIGNQLTPAVTALLDAFRTQASGAGTQKLTEGLGTFAKGWGFLVSYAQGKSNEYLLNLNELARAEEDAIADAMHAEWMRLENKKKVDAEAAKLAEQAKQRAEEEAAAEKAKAAEAKADELRKKQIEEMKSLRDQYDQLTMSENEYMAAKQKAAGYSENDIKRYQTLNKLVEEAKRKKQAEQDAERAKQGMASPQEQLQAELQRIEGMVSLGPDKGLSRGQGDKLAMEAAMRFGTQSGQEIAKNIAPTLKAGTKEAFTFMQQENAKSKQQAEQKKLAEDLLAEAKKANELAEAAPRLAFRR